MTGSTISRIYVDELKTKVYEIPIFDNVFLEYKATKDFGKYLERIEVVEHDFWCISLGLFSGKEKKTRNVDYWKVRFHFKKIPKEGLLRVDYI